MFKKFLASFYRRPNPCISTACAWASGGTPAPVSTRHPGVLRANLAGALLCTGLAGVASADQVFSDDVIVVGRMCVGTGCALNETFVNEDLIIKSPVPEVRFIDTSLNNDNWYFDINAGGGVNFFEVLNATQGGRPFRIEGAAPSSSLVIGANGDIGIGTSIPATNLHVFDTTLPSLRLERGAGGASTRQIWDLVASDFGMYFADRTNNAFPLIVETGAPSEALFVASNGDIAAGIDNPEGKLHTKGDGVQLIYFESGDGGPVQMRFRSNSQNRRFLAVDNDNNVQTQMQFRDDEILFLGATSTDEWLRVDATGITTMGGTCNVNPCDRTFDPSYFEVEPIEERAAYMWENMHLPAIGPTKAGEPINLTEKTTGIIHELEISHIYIEQLNARLKAESARNDRLEARLEALEAQ